LVYGSEAILPADVMWDSPAVEHYDEGVSEDSRRVDIDGLEEARCAALVQSARYLEDIQRYHDRNVKERSFNVGDFDNPTRDNSVLSPKPFYLVIKR
jgi:hypothetical protein